MSNDYSNNKFKKLLDKLQQESWQLELLISGFAIFGLFSALDYIYQQTQVAALMGKAPQIFLLSVVMVSCYILITNLLIHVVLRGLWIGALGLRYISGDINFEELKYHDKFSKYLKRKVVSFDKYVATLENYCSIIFAISFLLIFYVISFSIILTIIGIILSYLIRNDDLPEIFREITGYSLIVLIAIGTLLVLIDFFTLGYLKKKKILAKIYFPFYWVFSYLTLSFLYRPLVYNLLDNKFGKRISIFLVPTYIVIAILTGAEYKFSNYFDTSLTNTAYSMQAAYYENLHPEDDKIIEKIAIQSKVIKENYIKLFCVFNYKTENNIIKFHPDLKPENDARGMSFFSFKNDDSLEIRRMDSLSKKYIEVFNQSHRVYIDSSLHQHEFLITENKNKQLGFETYLPLKNIDEGKHILYFKRLEKKKDKISETEVTTIPFWYFKP